MVFIWKKSQLNWKAQSQLSESDVDFKIGQHNHVAQNENRISTVGENNI